MSTVTKLDPTVREARSQRVNIIRSLERIVPRLSGLPAISASLVLSSLLTIQHDTSLSGRLKSRLFTRVIKRLEAT